MDYFVFFILSVSLLAIWLNQILQYHTEAIFTRTWTWLTSTHMSNMWLCSCGKRFFSEQSERIWVTMAAVVPLPCGALPSLFFRSCWKHLSDAWQTGVMPDDGFGRPPLFFKVRNQCSMSCEVSACEQGMQVTFCFIFFTMKPVLSEIAASLYSDRFLTSRRSERVSSSGISISTCSTSTLFAMFTFTGVESRMVVLLQRRQLPVPCCTWCLKRRHLHASLNCLTFHITVLQQAIKP